MADFSKYYRAYMYMTELLQNDFTYNYITENMRDGDKGNDTLDGKTNEKVIDMDWVVAIEEALPYIQKAIDEQRRFIKQVENVVRIELAKKVGPDSVKHLSQHTNFIAKVEDGMVTPNKLLTIEREESFAIYENRVLMTLIRKALHFVDDKYSKMKDVPNDSYNKIQMTRHLDFNEKKVDFTINYINESHDTLADDLDVLDVTALSDFDRIRRIRTTLNEFLNTQLMKEIAKEPEVRPPITQTNLLKKNPNFKKAMELWNFLDSYKRQGFEIVGEEYQGKMTEQVQQDVYFAMGFEHFIMSIATNPGLRNILQQKYEEENARLAEEAARPEKARASVLQAQIDAVRKEEMEIRLREIREREKKILDLTNEIKTLKNTLLQKEQQILELKGKVSMLEDEIKEIKEELKQTKLKLLEAENKIKELTEENEQLKAKVAELEVHIEELNATIAELNAQIDALNAQIAQLTEENAQLKAKIAEQEQIIEQQKARIAELDALVAEQVAKIAALNETIEKCEAKIAEDAATIKKITDDNNRLNATLQTEREQAKQREQSLKADFAEKTRIAEEAHKNEVNTLQHKIDDSESRHTAYVAKLNAEFAEQTGKAEQKHIEALAEKQKEFEKHIEKIKQSNADATAAADARHASQIRKVQKSVDKRVEEAKKAAEKQYNAKIKELKSQQAKELAEQKRRAKEEIRLAKQKAKTEIREIKLRAKKKLFTVEELNNLDDIN